MELPFDLDSEMVALIQKDAVRIPPYPAIALRINRLIDGGEFGLDDLAKLVEADQGLAAAVLRSANSAYFSASNPVTSLSLAVNRMGARELANLALATSLGGMVNTESPLTPVRRQAWQRGLASALLCQELAVARKLNRGEAFLCGLLHDFGEMITYSCAEQVLAKHARLKALPAAFWAKLGVKYHQELGLVLGTKWGLPPIVMDCITGHHLEDLSVCQFRPMVELMRVADVIVPALLDAPSVEEKDFARAGLMAPLEREVVHQVAQRLPLFLASFEANPEAAPRRTVPTLVKPVDSTLADPKKFDAPIFAVVDGLLETYTAELISQEGIRMKGGLPLRERFVVELELGTKNPVTCWAQIRMCLEKTDHYVIEFNPFAMDKDSKSKWAGLLASLQGPSAPSSPVKN